MYLFLTLPFVISFVYIFLDKYYTRHIGPGPLKASHRHPEDVRRKRKEVVTSDSLSTVDILKIYKPENTLVKSNNYLIQADKAGSLMKETKENLEAKHPDGKWITPDTMIIEG